MHQCLNLSDKREGGCGVTETYSLQMDNSRLARKFGHVIASSSAESKTWAVAVVAKRMLNIKDVWTSLI